MTTTEGSTERGSLGHRAARAAVWNVATFAIGRVVLLVTTIVAGRLLEPEDFGLLGLALTVTTFLDVLNDFGLTTAYVYFARRSEQDTTRSGPAPIADTTFCLSLGIGLVLTLLTLAVSPLVASFYGEPEVTAILAVLSVNFLIVSFGSVQDGRMRARLDFKRRFFAELGRASTKGAVTITLAALGLGVWSLVLGQVIGAATSTLLYIVLERWRPRLRIDRALARQMLRYGFQLASVGVLGLAVSNIDYVVIGRRLGTEALGFYTIAFRLPSLAVKGTSSVVSQVVFSAYAKLADDEPALRRAMLRSMRLLAYFTAPVSLGMAVVAPTAITVLFGDKWAPAGTVMQLLAVYALLSVLVYNAGDVYKAVGRPTLLTGMAALNLVLAAPLLWVAAGRDIEAVAAAQIVVASAALAVQLVLLHRVLAVTPLQVVRTLLPALVASAAMVGATAGAMALLSGVADPARLAAAVLVGALTYGAVLRTIDREGVESALRLVRSRSPQAR